MGSDSEPLPKLQPIVSTLWREAARNHFGGRSRSRPRSGGNEATRTSSEAAANRVHILCSLSVSMPRLAAIVEPAPEERFDRHRRPRHDVERRAMPGCWWDPLRGQRESCPRFGWLCSPGLCAGTTSSLSVCAAGCAETSGIAAGAVEDARARHRPRQSPVKCATGCAISPRFCCHPLSSANVETSCIAARTLSSSGASSPTTSSLR